MERQTKAYLYALSAVALWSTVATAFKLALREMDYAQLLFFASAFSCLALFIALAVQGKLGLIAQTTRTDLARSALLGFLNPCLYYLVLLKAYSLLPAHEAQALNYTWAIALALLAVPLLGQRIGARSGAAIFFGFLGVLVISTGGDVFSLRFTSPLGDALAVGSSVIWALYWIYNMKDARDPLAKLFVSFLFGAVFSLAAMLLISGPPTLTPTGLFWTAYVGFIEMGLTFVLFMLALSHSSSSSKVGSLIYLSPVLSLGLIHFVLGEEITIAFLAGFALVMAGILLQASEGNRDGAKRKSRA